MSRLLHALKAAAADSDSPGPESAYLSRRLAIIIFRVVGLPYYFPRSPSTVSLSYASSSITHHSLITSQAVAFSLPLPLISPG